MLQNMSSACSLIMQIIHKYSYSPDTAIAVDSMWKNIGIIYDAHNLSKMITYTTQALIVVTTWTMFDWVTYIVNHAISHPKTPSWVTCLVSKIRESIQAHHAHHVSGKKINHFYNG